MTSEELANKSIAVLLSGGVDSAVAVSLLAAEGLHPDCFYIRIGPEEDKAWDCTSEEDIEMATAVARKYGCRLEVVDCHEEYWREVTRYTMDKVRAGLTPNPDVMCNRLIKFGAFDTKAGHAYDLIATGHYAQTEIDTQGRKWLTTSPDPVKDQTDFLARIERWQLRKALFPIGHLTKDEVRLTAEREHLVNARRKDSQGICFLGKVNYNEYIKRYLGERPGDIVEIETGRLIGRHRGLWFHTIGQRHGLGLGGGPWFVVKKDTSTDTLFVSRGYDPQAVYRRTFTVCNFHFLTCEVPLDDVTFKIRHTPEFRRAKIQPWHEPTPSVSKTTDQAVSGLLTVNSEEPIHGVAPGQFCVVYDRDSHRCLGCGEITMPSTISPSGMRVG